MTYDVFVLVEDGKLDARNLDWQQSASGDSSQACAYNGDLGGMSVGWPPRESRSYFELSCLIDSLLAKCEIGGERVVEFVLCCIQSGI